MCEKEHEREMRGNINESGVEIILASLLKRLLERGKGEHLFIKLVFIANVVIVIAKFASRTNSGQLEL